MGLSRQISNVAHFNPSYRQQAIACQSISEAWFTREYIGSGIPPAEHPLADMLDMRSTVCGSCQGQEILVIYAKRSIHPANGDEYFDYEVICSSCGKFTLISCADN